MLIITIIIIISTWIMITIAILIRLPCDAQLKYQCPAQDDKRHKDTQSPMSIIFQTGSSQGLCEHMLCMNTADAGMVQWTVVVRMHERCPNTFM